MHYGWLTIAIILFIVSWYEKNFMHVSQLEAYQKRLQKRKSDGPHKTAVLDDLRRKGYKEEEAEALWEQLTSWSGK